VRKHAFGVTTTAGSRDKAPGFAFPTRGRPVAKIFDANPPFGSRSTSNVLPTRPSEMSSTIQRNDRRKRIAMIVLYPFFVAGLLFIYAKCGHTGRVVFNVISIAAIIFSLFWQLRIIKKNPDKPILRLKSTSPFWRIWMAFAIVLILCGLALIYSDYSTTGKLDGSWVGTVMTIGWTIWAAYLLRLQKKQENRP
jgi:hypothetical protein